VVQSMFRLGGPAASPTLAPPRANPGGDIILRVALAQFLGDRCVEIVILVLGYPVVETEMGWELVIAIKRNLSGDGRASGGGWRISGWTPAFAGVTLWVGLAGGSGGFDREVRRIGAWMLVAATCRWVLALGRQPRA